jgi:hypothetical protein
MKLFNLKRAQGRRGAHIGVDGQEACLARPAKDETVVVSFRVILGD